MKIEQIPVGFMQVFCYLVYDDNTLEGVLIDPAGNEDDLLEHIEKIGISLLYVVNTHGHADHTSGNEKIRQATGAKVIMHEEDDTYYQRPEGKLFARNMGFTVSGPADIRVKGGEEISVGKLKMKIIHTPGHTRGACCILIDGNLFTGDTLFVGAVGRTDLPGGSFKQLIESLQNLVRTLPPDTIVWPGHDYGERPRSTLAKEKETNPYISEYLE